MQFNSYIFVLYFLLLCVCGYWVINKFPFKMAECFWADAYQNKIGQVSLKDYLLFGNYSEPPLFKDKIRMT